MSFHDFRVELVARHSNQRFVLEQLLRAERSAATSTTTQLPKEQFRRPRSIIWRLGQQDRQALVERYKQGESPYRLADEYGISRQSVICLVDAAGVPRQQRRMSAIEVQRAIRMYEDGQSMRVIARELRYGKATIWNHLHAANVQIHGANKPDPATHA